jgi:hypothetical protein
MASTASGPSTSGALGPAKALPRLSERGSPSKSNPLNLATRSYVHALPLALCDCVLIIVSTLQFHVFAQGDKYLISLYASEQSVVRGWSYPEPVHAGDLITTGPAKDFTLEHVPGVNGFIY